MRKKVGGVKKFEVGGKVEMLMNACGRGLIW
jgi:hypothetical protein